MNALEENEDTTLPSFRLKKIQDMGQVEKPVLKVGIVLPRQIFQQRRYQTIIRNSLSEIAQEKCIFDESVDEEEDDGEEGEEEEESTDINETENGYYR